MTAPLPPAAASTQIQAGIIPADTAVDSTVGVIDLPAHTPWMGRFSRVARFTERKVILHIADENGDVSVFSLGLTSAATLSAMLGELTQDITVQR